MRHLIDPLDFSPEEIDSLLNLADRIRSDPAAYQDVAAHKKLATLFYEPSTRTRLSFEAAMLNLGGHVLGFPSENVSSASKGESVADTIRVISCYADIVAMRHSKEGAPLRASRYSRIPVINAGDGGHQHPTQTMTDLMTIRSPDGPAGQPDHRPVRRSEVRPHRPLSHQDDGPLQKHPLRAHQPGGAAGARLHHQGCAGSQGHRVP